MFSYFVWFGTLNLIWLSIQDYKNKMKIDDRKNIFMLGVAVSLISHLKGFNIWYLLALLVIIALLNKYLKQYEIIGEGDANALTWIFYGFGIINIYYLMWFAGVFAVCTIIYETIKRSVFRLEDELPFMPVVLISFAFTAGLFKLY